MSKTAKQNKETTNGVKIFISISVILIIALLVGVIVILGSGSNNDSTIVAGDTLESGKQVITINTKGGYSPNNITAKAGTPSILRFATKNTFDCSTALVIKQLNISKNLPPNGNTDIEVPAQVAGSVINGSCSMGMYFFEIKFL